MQSASASQTSLPSLSALVSKGKVHRSTVLAALPLRLILFAVFQSMIALFLSLNGSMEGWKMSAGWWLISATLTNLVTIYFLSFRFRAENTRYFQVIHFEKGYTRLDLLFLFGFLLISAPLIYLFNTPAAQLIFGNSTIALAYLFRPLPLWAAWLGVIIFPITIAFAELPFYFGYIMPRLHALKVKPWLVIALPVLFLAAQHCTLPLIFDWRFILWRFLMFLPFALLLGLALYRRPRMLPYLMIVHALMDLSTAVLVLMAAFGKFPM